VRIAANRHRLRIEVADDATTELSTGSWGLRLVAGLCRSWGVTEQAGRQVVWCELTE
jgi:hypothetical protein